MGQDGMFPDYQPKNTPDIIFDYGVEPGSRLADVLNELGVNREDLIPTMVLEKLELAIELFKQYKPLAEKNPGKYIVGNLILGAPEQEYKPSEEELIVSEIGKLIQNLMFNDSHDRIREYKEFFEIEDQALIYRQIDFTHMDVMGSGRFFYAEKMKERIRLNI